MQDLTDQQLLCEYASSHSELAFAELVRRHVDHVYSAGLRMVRDTHLAEDVTQAAFVALARSAAQLTDRPVLSGWLHRTAQNIAAQTVRTDVRRRAREQEAISMNELLATGPDASWETIAPHLDAALAELNEPDRDALLLRYFERKSAHEMAHILGVSDEAAQKRVSRAVDRLRAVFARRGVTVGAAGLAVMISAHAVQSAPIGLAALISTAAAAGGTSLVASAIITTTKTIAMTTLQKAFIATTLIAAVGAGIFGAHQTKQLHDLQQAQASLADQLQQLTHERDTATNQLAQLQAATAQLDSKPSGNELLRLRGKVTQLQNAAADPTVAAAKAWYARLNQLKQWLANRPNAAIPEFQLLSDEDWLAAVKGQMLDTDASCRRAASTLRDGAEGIMASDLSTALHAYMNASGNQFPTDLTQLTPYLQPPVDASMLQRWEIVPASTVPGVGVGSQVITEISAVDDILDQRNAIGSDGFGSMGFLDSETRNLLMPVYKAFSQANSNPQPGDFAALLAYAQTPEQQAALQKLIAQHAFQAQ